MLITEPCLETDLTLLSNRNSDVTVVTEDPADLLTAYSKSIMTWRQYFYVELAIVR